MPATDGSVSFHTRVASNVIAMVERELVLGPQQDQDRAVVLGNLGVETERDLALAIRAGRFEQDPGSLVSALTQGVLGSLIVSRPTYLDAPTTAAQ
jgi:hypothetical protein